MKKFVVIAVLVSSADGVGTKLRVAFMTGIHDTVGEDLVNHCVNDILVQGARPLFFLDYIATGVLAPEIIVGVVEGVAFEPGLVRPCEIRLGLGAQAPCRRLGAFEALVGVIDVGLFVGEFGVLLRHAAVLREKWSCNCIGGTAPPGFGRDCCR